MQKLCRRHLYPSVVHFFFNILVKTFPGNSEECCKLKCCTKILINNITKWHDLLGVQANILCYSYDFLFEIQSLVLFAGTAMKAAWDTLARFWLLRYLVLTLAGCPGRGICPCAVQLLLSQNYCVYVNKVSYIWNLMILHHFFSPFAERCPSKRWLEGRSASVRACEEKMLV